VHVDIKGPFDVPDIHGNRYSLGFHDEATGLLDQISMVKKSEATLARKRFEAGHASLGKIKLYRLDNAREFTGTSFERDLVADGVSLEFSAPNAHNQLYMERAWRSTVTLARAMLRHANLPKQFWSYALAAAFYLRNYVPSGQRPASPIEMVTGRPPLLDILRVFGCTMYSNIPCDNNPALADTAVKGIFVGYSARK
jgi:hypothetical protein